MRTCLHCGGPRARADTKFCSRACYLADFRAYVATFICGTGRSHVRVRRDGKRVYLHRLVYMEAHGLDTLPDGAIVHHIDGNRHNNLPANLELITGNARAEHLARHSYHKRKGAESESENEL